MSADVKKKILDEWAMLRNLEESDNEPGAGDNCVDVAEVSEPHPIIREVDPNSANTIDILRGCVGLVELGTEARSLPLRAALSALGATVVACWSPVITHLIWGEGGCRKIRAIARRQAVHVVSPLWVEACAASGRRPQEELFPAASRPSDLPSPRTLQRLLIAELQDVSAPTEPSSSGVSSSATGFRGSALPTSRSADGKATEQPSTSAAPTVSQGQKPQPRASVSRANASCSTRDNLAEHRNPNDTKDCDHRPRAEQRNVSNDPPRTHRKLLESPGSVPEGSCVPKLRNLALSVIYEESMKLIGLDFTGMYLTPEGTDPASRVNVAPRRALPVLLTPPTKEKIRKIRRQLFPEGETANDSDDPASRVNIAPRRALPTSITPPSEESKRKVRRRLFTQREPTTNDTSSSNEDEDRPGTSKERKRNRNKNAKTETVSRPQGADYIRSAHGDRVARPARVDSPPSTACVARGARAEEATRQAASARGRLDQSDIARAERMASKLVTSVTKKPTTKDERFRIVLTSMTKEERNGAHEICKTLQAKVQRAVNKRTTHVIVGTLHEQSASQQRQDPNVLVRHPGEVLLSDNTDQLRTFSALSGAVRGCRVLRLAWAEDSLAYGRWIVHYGYEVESLKKVSQKAYVERKAFNLLGASYAYKIFNGARVKLSESLNNAEAVSEILSLCGAVTLNNSNTITNNAQLLKVGDEVPTTAEPEFILGRDNGEVNTMWLVECVAAARLRNHRRYINGSG